MTDRRFSALTLGLMATTAMAAPAFAQDVPPAAATQPQTTGQSPAPGTNATDVTGAPPLVQQAQDGEVPDETEIVITATKREENLQNVPISVQAIGTRRLDQLNITNFEDYTKQLPSVTFQTVQPGFTTVYVRGVAAGGDGNHSGSLPSVGTYLDEQPVTTIGGTLDVHIYDIARIESLAGPQGTLFGASSEAGTIRIITNKPELGVTTGRVDAEMMSVAHGGIGGNLEGMINIPIGPRIAFRGNAFYQHDAGYIDNVLGEQTYLAPDPADDVNFDNAEFVKKNFNDQDIYGGRAALKIDLDDNWTATPQFMYQKLTANGIFFMDKGRRDLTAVRFQDEIAKDRFWQAALTVQGKIANFDVTYAGAYMDRPRFSTGDYNDYTDTYNRYYIDYYNNYVDTYGYGPSFCTGPGILGCNVYQDDDGNIINPRQHTVATDHFKKMSHELRVATPADQPIRALAGVFYQQQKNHIFQNYLVDNLAANLSVTDYPGTIWLTNERREDKDYALFGEASWDITPQFTVTGGLRFYKFDNTLFGFAGFGSGNVSGSHTGEDRCLTVNGDEAFTDPTSPLATGDSGLAIPCYNVADIGANGKAIPRRSKGSGHIHRVNAQWKPQEHLMFYGTWSKGFRPGGINRQPETAPYSPDFLTNYEVGWKTTLLGSALRWNGAIFHEKWDGIQLSYLGPNSLTITQNGRSAISDGIETDINYVGGGLTLNAAAAYTRAKTKGNVCHASIEVDPSPDCTGLDSKGKPDYIIVPSGTRLPITPKLKASFTARYTWPMWAGRTHVQGALSYQGSAPTDIQPADNAVVGRLRAYSLLDLFVGYDWDKYSAELFGTNIFDKRNQLSRFVVCGGCDQVHIVPGRPRTIGLRVGAKF
jgi:outer membrane receptor protein involved in Fe transport